jgi:hypothetical protein
MVAMPGQKATIAAGVSMAIRFNSKRARWARPLFAALATAVTVLSLSPTGPRSGAGKCVESVASITHCDVDNRDEGGGGEILKSSSPAERDW